VKYLNVFLLYSTWQEGFKWDEIITETYELTEECIKINYYGPKRMCEAFIPLLKLSDSPRIVNVSSSMGQLKVSKKRLDIKEA